jgi:hypothetical protein
VIDFWWVRYTGGRSSVPFRYNLGQTDSMI